MALITASEYRTASGLTPDASRLQFCVAAIDGQIKSLTRQRLEAGTATEYHDAPADRDVIHLRELPVRAVTSVHYDAGGYYGQGANAFAAATLLTAGTDYAWAPDQPDGTSRSGRLQSLRGNWGRGFFVRPPYSLDVRRQSNPGAIRVIYSYGYLVIPEDLKAAAMMAVSRLLAVLPTGLVTTSENWNGYGFSTDSSALAKGILKSPDIWLVLSRYARDGGVYIG